MYRGWWIVLTAFLSQFASTGASGWVFGVLLLPMQEDLGASRSAIVGVLVVQRLIGGFAGAFLGPLIDRYGTRLLTSLSALVAGASLFGLALVQEPWQPYVAWAVFGLTLPGLSTVAPVAAISSWFVRQRTQAIVTYTFGGAVAGLVLAPSMAVVANSLSWRAVWVCLAVMFWALVPLAWATIRRRPEDLGLSPDGQAPEPSRLRSGPARPSLVENEDWTVSEALKSRTFWLLTAGFTLTMLPASSIFIHMTSHVQSKGFSLEEGATAVSIYGFGAVLGRFFWGFMVARGGLRRALVGWAFLYGVSIILYALPSSILLIYAASVLLGVAVAGSLQFRAQVFPDFYGRHIVGSLVGYSSAIGTLAGAAAPLIVAYAFDLTGEYGSIFILFGVCCLAAGVAFMSCTPRRVAQPQMA
jgi:MFS family permease